MRRPLLLAALVAALSVTPAQAHVIDNFAGLQSHTNGIVLGPDGNFWIAESGSATVLRMSPSGAVVGRVTVGANPTSLAVGPNNRVWVTVTGEDKLVWLDGTGANLTPNPVPTSGQSTCGPVAIVNGGNGSMYFSLPDDGCGSSRVGSVGSDGGGMTSVATLGNAFDLEVAGGKLWVPDFDGGDVRRVSLGLVSEASFPVGGSPDGIAADGAGALWVTRWSDGAVSRIAGGIVTPFTPSSPLGQPFGIVAGADGNVYVTGSATSNLQRISPSGTFTNYPVPGTHQPWQVVNGPDGDIWFTDNGNSDVHRFVSAAPRATTNGASALSPTSASFSATVDPRGNDTQVVFDYGPTTAYGSTTAAVNVPAGTTGIPVNAAAQALPPGTTLHVRVRATNGEGSVTGADQTFTTPPQPVALLPASTTMGWRRFPTYLILRKVRVELLRGGETIRMRCRGRGCPFKSRRVKVSRRGARNFGRLFRKRKLRVGARLTVTVTQPGAIGRVTILTVRRRKEPRLQRRCLPPGTTRPRACT